MPRLAANLSMLFNEVEFLERFEAASAAGFTGVEYLFPYDYPAAELARRLQRFGLTQVVHNVPCGDWAAGERGIACLPGRIQEFREGVDRAIDYAGALGCRRLNCLAGIVTPGVEYERAHAAFVENLAFAAERLKGAGIELLTEAVNTRDVPGFFLTGTEQALAVVEEVGADNLALQYDIYHMQIMEGDLAQTLERNLPRIAHVQLADNPGRHEPGSGEINYPFLLGHLDRIGYTGWIGCEYKPATTTLEGLSWAAPYL